MSATDRIDLLIQAQNRYLWCWSCGISDEVCRVTTNSQKGIKCCPDCRHPTVAYKDMGEVQLYATPVYLCEVVDHCTCAAPEWGEQVVHEPFCGVEPIYPMDKVMEAVHQNVVHVELQARANAYYEAAVSHQTNPDYYKHFWDKRQEILAELHRSNHPSRNPHTLNDITAIVNTDSVRRDCAICGRERSLKDDNHAPDCAYWDFFGPGNEADDGEEADGE